MIPNSSEIPQVPQKSTADEREQNAMHSPVAPPGDTQTSPETAQAAPEKAEKERAPEENWRLTRARGVLAENTSVNPLPDTPKVPRKSLFKRPSNHLSGGITSVPTAFKTQPQLGGVHKYTHSPLATVSEVAPVPHSSAPTPPRPSKHKPPRWIPNQHGAWPMLIVPFWVGVGMSRFLWQDLLLFAFWTFGFFFFDAFTTWAKTRRERALLPVQVWGALTLITGAATVILLPALLEWAVIFAPLLAGSGYLSWRRKERSLTARSLAVAAASLMCAVTYDAGSGFSRGLGFSWLEQYSVVISPPASPTGQVAGWPWVFMVTCALAAYFWSTIPYVKSLVRERASEGFFHFSVAAHCALAALAFVCWQSGWFDAWFAGMWALLAARSFLVPWAQKRGLIRIKVKHVGLAELLVTLVYVVSLFG